MGAPWRGRRPGAAGNLDPNQWLWFASGVASAAATLWSFRTMDQHIRCAGRAGRWARVGSLELPGAHSAQPSTGTPAHAPVRPSRVKQASQRATLAAIKHRTLERSLPSCLN